MLNNGEHKHVLDLHGQKSLKAAEMAVTVSDPDGYKVTKVLKFQEVSTPPGPTLILFELQLCMTNLSPNIKFMFAEVRVGDWANVQ